jgi:quercetin dioxygenase-like cupin family protein
MRNNMMRALWILLGLMSMAVGTAFAQDPVVVDSTHYSLVFENEQVRVLRIQYGPEEESVMHDHPDGVAVALNDSHMQFTLPDGQVVESEIEAGSAIWAPAGPHVPKNLTDQSSELILVEIKQQPQAVE